MKYTSTNGSSIVFQNIFYDVKSGSAVNPIETQNYSILQAADSYYLSEFQIPPHKQYCDLEITYVSYNGMDVGIDRVSESLSKGEAHIALKGEIHTLSCKNNCRFQTLAIDFKDTAARGIFSRIDALCRSRSERVFKCRGLGELFRSLVSEFHSTDDELKSLALDSLITRIILALVRGEGSCEDYAVESAGDLVSKILNYIDSNFLYIQNLDELANYFGYSYNHLYKIFKKYGNETLQSYLLRVKMEYAKEQLLKNKRVSEVSRLLGYTTTYNFSRAYKNFFDISPSNKNNEQTEDKR